MELKEILSVSGKSGLFKVVAQTKNGAIVESLIDKKRFPVFTSDKISSLADISVFCEAEEMPLKDVLKRIYDKENAQKTINHNEAPEKLKAYFLEVLPEYDKERVYVSDIKKVINWYNLLLENEMLNFEEPKDEAEVNAEAISDEKVEDAEKETADKTEEKKEA